MSASSHTFANLSAIAARLGVPVSTFSATRPDPSCGEIAAQRAILDLALDPGGARLACAYLSLPQGPRGVLIAIATGLARQELEAAVDAKSRAITS